MIEKINDFIDNLMYWMCMILGMVIILGSFCFMFYCSYEINPWMLVFPILMLIAVRKMLWSYIKGIVTLDRSDFLKF